MNLAFDPYILLGIAPDVSTEDIKAAYRRIALRLHPDRNPNPGAAVQLQDINQAHTLLLDPAQRSAYDRTRHERINPAHPEFLLRVTPSKRYVQTLPEPQVIYLLAEIYTEQSTTSEAEERSREARLNLTIVMDRSNSMSGTRLDRVKSAANQIIDGLTPNDIFSFIAFNDFAEVVIDAGPAQNLAVMKSRISMLTASGGTEILRGLKLGVEQNKKHQQNERVNHIIMLTDGNTYGDQDECMLLAQAVAKEGIGISALGIGQEWNDEFLDTLTSTTGGVAEYVKNINTVQRFLDDHVRSLANTFAERLILSIAPDPDVKVESAFKLSPRPQPLVSDRATIALGNLQYHRMTSLLFQLELPASQNAGFRSIARIAVQGDILSQGAKSYMTVSDLSLGISNDAEPEDPPANVLDALGRLTLYRMQERAKEALDRGDVKEATRRLENLATRLFEHGEEALGQQALAEARKVSHTSTLSEEGRKALKYQTRSLLLNSGET